MNNTRRQLMISLAGTALLLTNGCASLRNDSEHDSALAELETLVGSISGETHEEATVIAKRIVEQSRSLLEAHYEFEVEFNRLAIDRDVTDDELIRLVTDYDTNRVELRNQLLLSQEELHTAIPDEAWPDVLEVLNRKQQARVPRRVREV